MNYLCAAVLIDFIILLLALISWVKTDKAMSGVLVLTAIVFTILAYPFIF